MSGSQILAGDIGGTKTLLCLGEVVRGDLRVVAKARYESASYADFSEVIGDFLFTREVSVIAACFGVAGAVVDGVCRTTNLPWVLDQRLLSRQLGGARVRLLNDLEAAAFGVLHLPEGDFTDLNPGAPPRSRAPRAVIAAGTGLGEALIVGHGAAATIVATEGGHCDFAPRDEREDRLLRWLRRKYPQHVSYERVLSGPGLVEVYRFLVEDSGGGENERVAAAMARGDGAAVVGEWGVSGRDPLCVRALDWFVRMYGAEAGNLVLKSLATGGLYVAGGIAPKILPVMRRGGFMDGFAAKGRFSALLQSVPVRVVLNPEVVLLGALHWAGERMCGVEK